MASYNACFIEQAQGKVENARMTCKDCKYFDVDNHPTTSGFMSRAGHCDKRVADGYDEYPMPECEICNLFEPKEDSWESVSK